MTRNLRCRQARQEACQSGHQGQVPLRRRLSASQPVLVSDEQADRSRSSLRSRLRDSSHRSERVLFGARRSANRNEILPQMTTPCWIL